MAAIPYILFNAEENEQKAAPSFNYVYDSGAVNVIEGNLQTGIWRPIFPADLGGAGSFSTFITGIGATLMTIPSGVTQWSLNVESGAAYVNGNTVTVGNSLKGGGYSISSYSSTPILVSGGAGSWIVVTYEV